MQTPPISIVIVDDEEKACVNLCGMLKHFVTRPYTIAGIAHHMAAARLLIERREPDLVFFDIEMPGESPLAFLSGRERNFEVIFVTAYQHFAVDAFRLAATDYILKPIDPDELVRSVDRCAERLLAKDLRHRYTDKRTGAERVPGGGQQQLLLKEANDYRMISFQDLLYFEAMKSYCRIFFREGAGIASKVMARPLSEYEELVPEGMFIRIHRSFLVNRMHIQKIVRKDQAYVVMGNDAQLPVSRRKYGELLTHNDIRR